MTVHDRHSILFLPFQFPSSIITDKPHIHPLGTEHTTNPERHTLASPPPFSLEQGGQERSSGARVQWEVDRKWLFSLAPGPDLGAPLLFIYLSPSHAESSTALASLLLFHLLGDSFSLRHFPPHCHAKQCSVCFTVETKMLSSILLQNPWRTKRDIFLNQNI